MSWRRWMLAVPIGLWSWGCGGQGDAAEEAPADAAAAAAPVARETGPGRDLSAVDVCTLVPAEVVAGAMGEKPSAAPTEYDPGFDGKGCRYTSGMRYAEVSLLPPAHFEFKQYANPKGQLHPVAGLADGAFWQDRTDRMDLYLLRSDDATIWVSFQERNNATQVEEARRLGEAVLASLK